MKTVISAWQFIQNRMFSGSKSTVDFARATLLGFGTQRRYETSAKIATTGLIKIG